MNDMTLVGNLVSDPVISTTKNGGVRAKLTIAVNHEYYTTEGVKMRTEFYDCVAWGDMAEGIGDYLCKGKEIVCVGEQESYTYEDQQNPGVKRRIKYMRLKKAGPSFRALKQKASYTEHGRQSVPQQSAPVPSNEPPAGFAGFGQAVPPMDDIPY